MADTKQTAIALMDPNLERTFRGHKSYVTSVAFSPPLKQLASGSGDNSVMLWNFKPQLRAFKFIGHKVCPARVYKLIILLKCSLTLLLEVSHPHRTMQFIRLIFICFALQLSPQTAI